MAEVAVGYMAGDTVDSEFVSSLVGLMALRSGDIQGRCIQTRGYAGRLDVGRHFVAKMFLERTEADYLLLVDSDIVFKVGDYDELIRSAEKVMPDERAVVSGVYAREDGSLCVYDYTDDGYRLTPPTLLSNTRWYEAGSVGLGFCVVSREVLELLEEEAEDGAVLPWFDNAEMDDGGRSLADDTSFCWRLRKHGVKIYVNTRVQVGHLKKVVVMPKLESDLVVPEKGLIVP